jgi:hypothetical protein
MAGKLETPFRRSMQRFAAENPANRSNRDSNAASSQLAMM